MRFLVFFVLFLIANNMSAQELFPCRSFNSYSIPNIKGLEPIGSVPVGKLVIRIREDGSFTIIVPHTAIDSTSVGDSFFFVPEIHSPVGDRTIAIKIEKSLSLEGFVLGRMPGHVKLVEGEIYFGGDKLLSLQMYTLDPPLAQ